MKILLVANYTPDCQKSMLFFADMLHKGLPELGYEVRLIQPKPVFCRFKQSYRGLAKWLGYIDKFLIFPFGLCGERGWADVVHICDHSNAHYVRYLKAVPNVVTCNDCLAMRSAMGEFGENLTRLTGRALQRIILNGLNKAQHVTCISEATRRDLLRIGSLRPENTSVIYMGFNYPYSPLEKKKAKAHLESLEIGSGASFMLHVGKNNWYKNRLGALDIFKHIIEFKEALHLKLVFAGDRLTQKMRDFIRKEHLEQSILEVISPRCEELHALYSTAEALLYPSLQEGFGWPIIEAQACGCPVFTTDRAPMTEAGGEAAVYINPARPKEAARIIVENLSCNREKMKAAGFLNVKRFSTEKMLREYVKIYERVKG